MFHSERKQSPIERLETKFFDLFLVIYMYNISCWLSSQFLMALTGVGLGSYQKKRRRENWLFESAQNPMKIKLNLYIYEGHWLTDRDYLNYTKYENMIWWPLKYKPITLADSEIQVFDWLQVFRLVCIFQIFAVFHVTKYSRFVSSSIHIDLVMICQLKGLNPYSSKTVLTF
jgi:hypothetical protein